MGKPFDVSKFRKSITKAIPDISAGFNDPSDWISTGNYALNYLVSGQFKGDNAGIPMGKVTMLAGDSGAGKSYVASGNLVKHAQEKGYFVVLVDTENALDETWLQALGVDTDESKLMKLSMCMIDDVAKAFSTFMKDLKAMPEEERPKVLFVIDSLGMLLTPTDVKQFDAGDMKGDLGRKPKALTAFIRNSINLIADLNVGLVLTNHTYASLDMFDPDDKITGGCLTKGHRVQMEDGTLVDISEINVGDVVKTMTGSDLVTKEYQYDDKEVFELELSNGNVIKATKEHKFLVESAEGFVWKKVDDLLENDDILFQ